MLGKGFVQCSQLYAGVLRQFCPQALAHASQLLSWDLIVASFGNVYGNPLRYDQLQMWGSSCLWRLHGSMGVRG